MFEKLLKILKITDEIISVIRSNSDKNKLLEKVDESVKEKLWLNLGGASVFVYGVRVPTTQNNKNSEADKYLLRYFGTLEGTSSKHTPCLNNFAEQNRNKHFVCFSSPHKVFDFVGTPK